jgi:hypothetical protein
MPNDIAIRPCGKGKSFFNFISDYWKASDGNDKAFHRICSLMRKMNAQNIIIEKYGTFVDEEAEEEKESLQESLKAKLSFDIFRFTFLRKEINKLDEISFLGRDNFLGNVILVNLQRPDGYWTSYILKSIITFPNKDGSSGLLNNYLHVINDFDLEVGVGDKKNFKYKIKGSYFTQQNGITSVCAHSCLKMLINNSKKTEKDFITTKYINKELDFSYDEIPEKGLNLRPRPNNT